MALNRVPIFPNTVREYTAAATTADTSLTAPAAAATVYTNSSGAAAKCTKLRAKAQGNTTASMLRIFLHDGTNYHLWREVLTSSITAGATTKSWEWEESVDIDLPNGWGIRATTHNGDDINVFASIGEYLYTA